MWWIVKEAFKWSNKGRVVFRCPWIYSACIACSKKLYYQKFSKYLNYYKDICKHAPQSLTRSKKLLACDEKSAQSQQEELHAGLLYFRDFKLLESDQGANGEHAIQQNFMN